MGRVPDRHETPDVARLRRRIDALDRRIVRLLNERASLALEVDGHRVARGRRAVRDPAREADVLRRVGEASSGPLETADLQQIYRRLMALTRRLQSARRLPSVSEKSEPPQHEPGGGRVPDR